MKLEAILDESQLLEMRKPTPSEVVEALSYKNFEGMLGAGCKTEVPFAPSDLQGWIGCFIELRMQCLGIKCISVSKSSAFRIFHFGFERRWTGYEHV